MPQRMGEENGKALMPRWATLAYDFTALAAAIDSGYPRSAEALRWLISQGGSDIFHAPGGADRAKEGCGTPTLNYCRLK